MLQMISVGNIPLVQEVASCTVYITGNSCKLRQNYFHFNAVVKKITMPTKETLKKIPGQGVMSRWVTGSATQKVVEAVEPNNGSSKHKATFISSKEADAWHADYRWLQVVPEKDGYRIYFTDIQEAIQEVVNVERGFVGTTTGDILAYARGSCSHNQVSLPATTHKGSWHVMPFVFKTQAALQKWQ